MDMSALRDLCLPNDLAERHHTNAVPHFARLSSDQWCHAYMNSDYSPYHGQQCQLISKNMQASTIASMLPGNRGELGKQALLQDNRAGFNFQRSLNRKQKQLVRQYENIADSLIDLVGDNMKDQDLNVGPARAHELGCYHDSVVWRHSTGRGGREFIMEGSQATQTQSAAECQQRCASVAGCAHFSWLWGKAGHCYLQDNTSTQIFAVRSMSGPQVCSPSGAATGQNGYMEVQRTENCFRCGTVGSTTTRRLSQNTYIPSFQIPQNLIGAVNTLIEPDSEYRQVVNFQTGMVQIYVSVVNDLNEEFQKAAALNITMQTARVKPYEESTNPNQNTLPCALKTHEDTTNFLKIDADGNTGDKGLYAAREAYKKYGGPPWRAIPAPPVPQQPATPLTASLAAPVAYGSTANLPATGSGINSVPMEVDPNGLMADTICEDETNENVSEIEDCPPPSEYLFSLPQNLEEQQGSSDGQGQVATGGAWGSYSYLSALGLLAASYLP
jgi:hypothetical protein